MPVILPKRKPKAEEEPYVPHVTKYAGQAPKECAFCKRVYHEPCDVEKAKACQNLQWLQKQQGAA
jgi:hypothetical protein